MLFQFVKFLELYGSFSHFNIANSDKEYEIFITSLFILFVLVPVGRLIWKINVFKIIL